MKLRSLRNLKISPFIIMTLGIKISINDLVIKAAATTLQYVPEVNLNVVKGTDGDDFQIMQNVDVSVAVATNEGLITPIVKNVPSLSLPQISSTVKDLAIKARNGQLKLDEFQVTAAIYCMGGRSAHDLYFIYDVRVVCAIILLLIYTGRNIYHFKLGYVWHK